LEIFRVENLSFTYPLCGSKALDNISLNIDRNEVVSIIGYSGSGKSSLIKCIAGLETIDSGAIVTDVTPRKGYSGIGMVFSKSNLFPHLTILQNLTLAPIKVLGMSKEEAEKEALQMLDTVGIWSTKDALPDTLSSGQRQRAAIARSLMCEPKVILCDEPTGNLDHATGDYIMKLLHTICKEENMAVLMITHNEQWLKDYPATVYRCADRKITKEGATA
jgi:ABC-type polar amino acid transport system ATPase subunit